MKALTIAGHQALAAPVSRSLIGRACVISSFETALPRSPRVVSCLSRIFSPPKRTELIVTAYTSGSGSSQVNSVDPSKQKPGAE